MPDGRPRRFVVAPSWRRAAADYERRIARDGAIETREGNPHDVANALAWLRFPRTKAALNAVHVRDADATVANVRSRARDAATLVDESGLVFACADAGLTALLRARRWRDLFWTRRDAVAARAFPVVIGHGLLEKLREPYRALTAQALIVDVAETLHAMERVDTAAAALVAAAEFAPEQLTPLPLAALPGWDCERLGERLFADRTVFRDRVLR